MKNEGWNDISEGWGGLGINREGWMISATESI